MRKLIMWNVVTLDGRFEGEKPWDLSFHDLVWGPELEALSIAQLEDASALVFGENTYKGMAEYWSKAEGKIADLMNSVKKIACSKRREKADWSNTVIVKDAVSEIRKLKDDPPAGGDHPLFVFGSAILSQSLMNAGLFDEIRLCVAPIVLGKGRHLFTDENTERNLKLLEARPLKNSGVVLRYEVANL